MAPEIAEIGNAVYFDREAAAFASSCDSSTSSPPSG